MDTTFIEELLDIAESETLATLFLFINPKDPDMTPSLAEALERAKQRYRQGVC